MCSVFPNGTNGIPISFKVLPMVPIGNTICTNGDANGTIGSPNGTIGTIGKPMVPLATNSTIGKITNGTIWRTPNRFTVDCLQYWLQSVFTNGAIGTNGITNGTIGRTLNDIGIPLVPLVEP